MLTLTYWIFWKRNLNQFVNCSEFRVCGNSKAPHPKNQDHTTFPSFILQPIRYDKRDVVSSNFMTGNSYCRNSYDRSRCHFLHVNVKCIHSTHWKHLWVLTSSAKKSSRIRFLILLKVLLLLLTLAWTKFSGMSALAVANLYTFLNSKSISSSPI